MTRNLVGSAALLFYGGILQIIIKKGIIYDAIDDGENDLTVKDYDIQHDESQLFTIYKVPVTQSNTTSVREFNCFVDAYIGSIPNINDKTAAIIKKFSKILFDNFNISHKENL